MDPAAKRLVDCSGLKATHVILSLATFCDPFLVSSSAEIDEWIEAKRIGHLDWLKLTSFDLSMFPLVDPTDFDQTFGAGTMQDIVDGLCGLFDDARERYKKLTACSLCEFPTMKEIGGACSICLLEDQSLEPPLATMTRLRLLTENNQRNLRMFNSAQMAFSEPAGIPRSGSNMRHPNGFVIGAQFIDPHLRMCCVTKSSLDHSILYQEHNFALGIVVCVNLRLHDAEAAVFTSTHCLVFTSVLTNEWEFRATCNRRWIRAVSLPQPIKFFTATVFRTNVLVCGGQGRSLTGQLVAVSSVWRLDLYKLTWTNDLASLPVVLSGHAAVVYRDKLWIAGGTSNLGTTAVPNFQVYAFDADENTWRNMGTVTTARCFPTLFVCDDQLFLTGGQSPDERSEVRFLERYDADARRFMETTCSDQGLTQVL